MLQWGAVGAGAATLAGGVALLAIDNGCMRRNEIGGCRTLRTTKLGGIVAISVGTLLAGGTGYLWADGHPQPPGWLARNRWSITAASAGMVVAGVTLIALDKPRYRILDDNVYPAYEYRKTLLAGGLVTAVGAVGVGVSTYLFVASRRGFEGIQPSASVSGDGASVGIEGQF